MVLLSLALLGCEVTSEKINIWKQSTKGAAKIRAALRDTGQAMEVRIEAAQALAEMGLTQPLSTDLASLSGPDRKLVTEALNKGLLAKMKGSNPNETTRVQVQAKDALYSIRLLLSDEERKAIDRELVTWILGDYQQRDAGDHSAEKIIKDAAQTGAQVLAEMIDLEGAPAAGIATLLRRNASEALRETAGKKLVALAKEQDPPSVATYRALGVIGSLTASNFLVSRVKAKGPLEPRVWAMRAVALYPHPSMIPMAKAFAADTSLKDDAAVLRDDAFTLLERIRHDDSLAALVSFLTDKDDMVRYRAVESIITGWGVKGATKLLASLPSSYTYKKLDLLELVERPVIALGNEILPSMRKALKSESWIARLIAVRILGKVGNQSDIPAVAKLTSDGTKLKGWSGGDTIGTEAAKAVAALKSR